MRPLFAYLRTMTVPTSVFAAPEDWGNPALTTRVDRAATELDTDLMRLATGGPAG